MDFCWDADASQLTVLIANTTPGSLAGTITAIAFHDLGCAVTLVSDSTGGFTQFADGILTPPPGSGLGGVGRFGVALAWGAVDAGDPELNANRWVAAGNGESRGLRFDADTAELKFDVDCLDPFSLGAADFIALNDKGVGMMLRFKGVGPDDESDLLILVPLPPIAWMAGIGLVGVGVLRRRWR